jgi:hypothetical protein
MARDPPRSTPGKDWVWREDRLQDLLATEDVDVLFLSGCAPNLGKFISSSIPLSC